MRLVVTTMLCGVLMATAAAATEAESKRGPAPYDPVERVDTRAFFTGRTVSAVAYLPQSAPHSGPNNTGASSLLTVMFQAYLQSDGTALVRTWDPSANRYTAVTRQYWRIDGDTFCIAVPAFRQTEPMCLDIHVWGPNFAGTGVNANGMVKGDALPGNRLGS